MPRQHHLKKADNGLRRFDAYVYQEEQRHLSGRITSVSRHRKHLGSGPGDPVSMAQRKSLAIVGNHSTRAIGPRHILDQPERDFQRYKTNWHIRRGNEEQERARLRRSA